MISLHCSKVMQLISITIHIYRQGAEASWAVNGKPDLISNLGFTTASDGKESAWNAGNLGSVPGLGRSPVGRHGNPLQYSCLENSMARERSQAGYSPWDHKESDTTEQHHFHFSDFAKATLFPACHLLVNV